MISKKNCTQRYTLVNLTVTAHWKSHVDDPESDIIIEFDVHPSTFPFLISASEFIHIRGKEHIKQIKKKLEISDDYSPFLADDETIEKAIFSFNMNMIRHKNNVYETCLPDIESILPGLARIIKAEYITGEFSKAEDTFLKSGKSSVEWILKGKTGARIVVTFEEFEGYLFIKVEGSGKVFERSKVYLYECYLSQGGNPDAQEKP